MQSHCKHLVLRVFYVSSFANPLLYLISLFIVLFVFVCVWLHTYILACPLQMPIHVHYLIV